MGMKRIRRGCLRSMSAHLSSSREIDLCMSSMKNLSLIDELEMHQPSINDAVTLRGYHQDLVVSKFLFGLSPSPRSQM